MNDSGRDLLVRYLRQRTELGEGELILDHRSAAELLSSLPGHAANSLRSAPPVAAPEPEVESGPEPNAGGPTSSLGALRAMANACTRCRLAETRSQVVFGEGNPAADLVVVGEAPGAEEDRSGRPFVGRAGKLLDLLLASAGFPREEVFICNVLKCRPPQNRNPNPDEIERCRPFLERQVEMLQPSAILACGSFSARTLLDSDEPIGRLRRSDQTYQGIPLVATYHPAALLRNPGWIRPVWEDLQRVRQILDSALRTR